MKRINSITHQFVDSIPGNLADGTLYVSIDYATVVHKCFCGCGREVVTPLTPTDWKLIYDGESISLNPSVGNWSFDCKSHYWIDRGTVKWAEELSDWQIQAGRNKDRRSKESYYQQSGSTQSITSRPDHQQPPRTESKKGLISWIRGLWR